jgi:hypothetical protein
VIVVQPKEDAMNIKISKRRPSMKKMVFFTGILGMLLIFGFLAISCDLNKGCPRDGQNCMQEYDSDGELKFDTDGYPVRDTCSNKDCIINTSSKTAKCDC